MSEDTNLGDEITEQSLIRLFTVCFMLLSMVGIGLLALIAFLIHRCF